MGRGPLTLSQKAVINMKTAVALVAVMMAVAVSGELLAALKRLQTQDFFKDLSPKDEILLTDLIAAAETCKLGAFDQEVGRPAIQRLLSHIPTTVEANLETYLKQHIADEQSGNCTVV